MLAEERKDKIINIIEKNRVAKVAELSRLLNTTEATVRRDLEELQKQKKVQRVHGGAISVTNTNREFDYRELSTICIEEKKRIAARAFEFVQDNDALLMDASTTVFELASLLLHSSLTGLSIITNSFNLVSLLRSSHIRVIHTGGQLSSSMNYAVGAVGEQMLSGLRVDKCFLGTNGIDPSYGYSVPSFEDASIKKCMLTSSRQKFILADHTKFGEAYLAKFASFTGEIDYLITDCLTDKIDVSAFDPNTNIVLAEA